MSETTEERRQRLKREKSIRYRARHPDRVKASAKKANARQWAKPEVRENSKVFHAARKSPQQREKNNLSVRGYREKNPEYKANRKSKGRLSHGRISRLFKEQDGKCAICQGCLETLGRHIDHILPFALGGRNVDDNVQLLCPTCNMRKGAKHPDVFRAEMRA